MQFDRSIFDTVHHQTKVIINDVEYEGFGVGKANEGLLSSQMNHTLKFDPEILAVHLIVGYPSYSEYKPGATDLFKPSTLLGGYKYQRKYKFSNGAEFNSFHNISFDKETGLSGVFTTRNFPEHMFTDSYSVSDLVETFIPSGPGLIRSVMAVEWKCGSNGMPLTAVIESEYYLNHNESLPGLHWRHVTFETDKSVAGRYRQSEKITVHRDLFSGAPQNLLDPKPDTAIKVDGKEQMDKEVAHTAANAAPIQAY